MNNLGPLSASGTPTRGAPDAGSTPAGSTNPTQRRRLHFVDRALRAFDRELARPGSRLRATLDRVPLQPHDQARQRDMYETRRAAVRTVMRDLLAYVDPVTLIVGRGAGGEHYGRRVDRLALSNHLDQRRAERALHDMHAAGWLTSTRRAEETAPGQWRGLTSVRQLSAQLFVLLGLAELLHKTRRRLYAARKAAGHLLDLARAQLSERGRKFTQRTGLDAGARSLGSILAGLARPPPKTA